MVAAITAKELKEACDRINENNKLERIWNSFKIMRRMAKKDGKELSIDVFNKMVREKNK